MLKAKTLALAGPLVLAGAATADFVGITVDEYVGDGWLANGYGATGLVTYRMYANFTGEDEDGVYSTFGLPGQPLSMNSTGGYHNDPLGGLTAPLDLRGVGLWGNQWDTYVTINATEEAGDETQPTPGFATLTNDLGSDWVTENGGWFVTNVTDQSFADENNQVLLAQMVASAANDPVFFGTIALLLRDGTFTESIAWSSPAPGTLAVLALAGVMPTRRRRS